jgi:hypothetical protein
MIKGSSGARAADSAAASSTSVPGDTLRPIWQAARELRAYGSREIRDELRILSHAPLGLALAAPCSRRTVDRAFLFGL